MGFMLEEIVWPSVWLVSVALFIFTELVLGPRILILDMGDRWGVSGWIP